MYSMKDNVYQRTFVSASFDSRVILKYDRRIYRGNVKQFSWKSATRMFNEIMLSLHIHT